MRKHAKDTGGEGGAGVEVEALDDGADGSPCHVLAYAYLADTLTQIRSPQKLRRSPSSYLGRLRLYTLKH